MQILAHRGYWKKKKEQNTLTAFNAAFENNFGIETDIRDSHGQIVIAHNPPIFDNPTFNAFLKLYKTFGKNTKLALNIKSDGLHSKLESLLTLHNITNYFFFDMSIPDTIQYSKSNLNFMTRQSEYEKEPIFYEECNGIWLDNFETDWYNDALIAEHLSNEKLVAVVSAELHGRDYKKQWEMLRSTKLYKSDSLLLCTDFPTKAKDFFYGKD